MPPSLDTFFESLGRLQQNPLLSSPPPPSDSAPRNNSEDTDDPGLTPDGEQLLVDLFIEHGSSRLALLVQRSAVVECLRDIFAPFKGDPRWPAIFQSRLFLAAAEWTGARSAHDRGTSGADKSFSRFPLSALLPKLQKRFIGLFRAELARFYLEARANGPPGSLQTAQNLSLLLTSMVTTIFLTSQMSRVDGAKAIVAQMVTIMRITRIPGETDIPGLDPPRINGVDDLLIDHLWRDVFWFTAAVDGYLCAMSQSDSTFDAVQEFPTAPFLRPGNALKAVPAPSQRGTINGEIPDGPLREPQELRCIDFLGWLDPCVEQRDDRSGDAESERRTMLMKSFAPGSNFPIGTLAFYGLGRVSAYAKWLKAKKLSLVGVLVAKDILSHGPNYRHLLPIDDAQISALLANPSLQEAVRRRNHLWNAFNFIFSCLPEKIAEASQGADLAAMLKLVEMLPDRGAETLLGFLTILRQSLMLLVSPEPFEDLGQAVAGSSGAPDSKLSASSDDGSGDATPEVGLLEAWFSSTSFLHASRHAAIISGTMRMITAGIERGVLQGTYVLFSMASVSATYAAWVHLLVLRRFRKMVAEANTADQARALTLYDDIHTDVQACLDILAASANANDSVTHGLLRNLLEDEEAQLTPADVQMLKMAQHTFKFCKHFDELGETGGGTCFLCAAERAEANSADFDQSSLGDPLARLPEMSLAGPSAKGKKRVRFSDKVEVFETDPVYDDSEERDQEEAVSVNAKAEEAKPALEILLMGRDSKSLPDFPNLQLYR